MGRTKLIAIRGKFAVVSHGI